MTFGGSFLQQNHAWHLTKASVTGTSALILGRQKCRLFCSSAAQNLTKALLQVGCTFSKAQYKPQYSHVFADCEVTEFLGTSCIKACKPVLVISAKNLGVSQILSGINLIRYLSKPRCDSMQSHASGLENSES